MNLEQLLQNTHNEIELIKNQIAASKTNEPDQIDNAKIQEGINLLQTHFSRKQLYLKKVAHAIVKQRAGTFGYCDACGGEIEKARLLINPSFECCTECQAMIELKGKQIGYQS